MTDNMFDKFVRDKLADHQSTVPPGLWEKIERKKDRDPRGGFFLPRIALWAGLFIIAAGVGVGYYVSTTGDNAEQTVQTTETAAAKNSGDGVNTTTASSNAGEEGRNTGNSTTNDHNTNTVPGTAGNSTAPDATTDDNTGGVKMNDSGADDANGSKYDGTSTTITPNNGVNTPDNVIGNNVIGNYTASRKAGRKSNVQVQKNKPVFYRTVDDIINAEPGNADMSYGFARGITAYNLRSLAIGDANKNYTLSDLKIVGIDCPPNGRLRRNDWYLEVYGSPDIVMKSVKANGNTSFVSKKDSTESQQLSFTGGFRISKSIGENLLVKTGLQYSQINERFDLRTENERRIITVVTIRTVIGSNGADSTISDTSMVEQIGYRLQRTYNRYRSIDIPILLSYEWGNENLKFAVNAGAIVNLYSWYSGNTINDSLNVVSMSSKGSVYKQNIGVGLYGGFTVIKPVSNKFDLFLEPYFRYNFSNMSRSAGYTQRFNAMGINLGIRYKLKGQRSGLN